LGRNTRRSAEDWTLQPCPKKKNGTVVDTDRASPYQGGGNFEKKARGLNVDLGGSREEHKGWKKAGHGGGGGGHNVLYGNHLVCQKGTTWVKGRTRENPTKRRRSQ